MPPIPIHTASPINTKGLHGRNLSIAESSSPYTPTRINTDAPTTPATPSASSSTYPVARPGAPSYSTPTGIAAPNPYAPRQPSPTHTTTPPAYDGPPMPLPGAVPDINAVASSTLNGSGSGSGATLPPPPRAGERKLSATVFTTPSTPTVPAPTYPSPPQLNIPPPTTNYTPTYSTTPSTTPSFSIPVYVAPISFSSPATTAPPSAATYTFTPLAASSEKRGSLEHPPGYMQNPRAIDMTAAQRAAQEMQERENTLGTGISGVLSNVVGGGSHNGGNEGVGLLSGGTSRDVNRSRSGSLAGMAGIGEGGVWDQAKSWFGGVAELAGEVEGKIWKSVSGVGK